MCFFFIIAVRSSWFVPDVTFPLNVMSNSRLTSGSFSLSCLSMQIVKITMVIFKWESHLEPRRSLWHLHKRILVWSLPRVSCYIFLYFVTHMLSVSQISRKFGSIYSHKGQASVDICVTAILVFLPRSAFTRNPFHVCCQCCCTFSSFCHRSSSSPAQHLQHSTRFNRVVWNVNVNITERLIGEHIPARS